MFTLITRLLSSRCRGSERRSPGWWEYFGSFGDDFFDEEPPVTCLN